MSYSFSASQLYECPVCGKRWFDAPGSISCPYCGASLVPEAIVGPEGAIMPGDPDLVPGEMPPMPEEPEPGIGEPVIVAEPEEDKMQPDISGDVAEPILDPNQIILDDPIILEDPGIPEPEPTIEVEEEIAEPIDQPPLESEEEREEMATRYEEEPGNGDKTEDPTIVLPGAGYQPGETKVELMLPEVLPGAGYQPDVTPPEPEEESVIFHPNGEEEQVGVPAAPPGPGMPPPSEEPPEAPPVVAEEKKIPWGLILGGGALLLLLLKK